MRHVRDKHTEFYNNRVKPVAKFILWFNTTTAVLAFLKGKPLSVQDFEYIFNIPHSLSPALVHLNMKQLLGKADAKIMKMRKVAF